MGRFIKKIINISPEKTASVRFRPGMSVTQKYAAIESVKKKVIRREVEEKRKVYEDYKKQNSLKVTKGLNIQETKNIQFIDKEKYQISLNQQSNKLTIAKNYTNLKTNESLVINPSSLIPYSKNKLRKLVKYNDNTNESNIISKSIHKLKSDLINHRDQLISTNDIHDEIFNPDTDILIDINNKSKNNDDIVFGDLVSIDENTNEVMVGVNDDISVSLKKTNYNNNVDNNKNINNQSSKKSSLVFNENQYSYNHDDFNDLYQNSKKYGTWNKPLLKTDVYKNKSIVSRLSDLFNDLEIKR